MKKIGLFIAVICMFYSCGQTPVNFNDKIVVQIDNADLYSELYVKFLVDSCLGTGNFEKAMVYSNSIKNQLEEVMENLDKIESMKGGGDFRMAAKNYIGALMKYNTSIAQVIESGGSEDSLSNAKLKKAYNKLEKDLEYKRELLMHYQKQFAKSQNLKMQETPKFHNFPIKGN